MNSSSVSSSVVLEVAFVDTGVQEPLPSSSIFPMQSVFAAAVLTAAVSTSPETELEIHARPIVRGSTVSFILWSESSHSMVMCYNVSFCVKEVSIK